MTAIHHWFKEFLAVLLWQSKWEIKFFPYVYPPPAFYWDVLDKTMCDVHCDGFVETVSLGVDDVSCE